MRNILISLIFFFQVASSPDYVYSQTIDGSKNQITSSDLESYVDFLASPLLKGRMNGEEGLEIAAQYIASQAKLLGLKPANGTSYFQPFTVLRKGKDSEKQPMQIIINNKDTITIEDQRYHLGQPVSGRSKEVEEVKVLNNIAACIEGSDSLLKKEVIVYSCHYDHIGTTRGKINAGADDNASGCAALLSIAKAFQSLEKKPLRSILFLWFSGEEIGLFGSEFYVENPLFPTENTLLDLNMDMIGREKMVADSTSETPMTGPNSVFVITDNQSKELAGIVKDIDDQTSLDFDYSLSGRYHPLQLFARSDHYNFVKKDIPILCFTTGIHTDYHTPGDVVSKLDFKKMEIVARSVYEIGFAVANKSSRLVNDNPYSKWGKH
jgi:putative aminopeptidase FrvX